MATIIGRMPSICKQCESLLKPLLRSWNNLSKIKLPKRYLIIPSVLFAECKAAQALDLQPPDTEKLTQQYLIKSASAQTSDSVSTLLSQTAHALIEAELKYREMLEVLIQLLEFHATVLGNKDDEDRVWDVVLQGRSRVEACEKHVRDLQLLFGSLAKLVDATAEVAFLAGCDFTSTSLGERLYNARQHVDNAHKESDKVYMQLQETQARCIKKIADFGEKAENRKRKDEQRRKFMPEAHTDAGPDFDELFNEDIDFDAELVFDDCDENASESGF